MRSALTNIEGVYWLKLPPECSCKRLFLFLNGIRTPHESRAFAWMAWNKTPHTVTPLCKRRPALIDRLVKHWVAQVETRPNV